MLFVRSLVLVSLVGFPVFAARERTSTSDSCPKEVAGKRRASTRLSRTEAETLLWGTGGESVGSWEEIRVKELEAAWVDRLARVATEHGPRPEDEATIEPVVDEEVVVAAATDGTTAKAKSRRVEAAVRRFHTGVAAPVTALAAESNLRIFAGLDTGRNYVLSPREAPRLMGAVVDDGKPLQAMAYVDVLKSVALLHPSGLIAFRPQHRKMQERERRYFTAKVTPIKGRVELATAANADWLFAMPGREAEGGIEAIRVTVGEAERDKAKDFHFPQPLPVFPATAEADQLVAFAYHAHRKDGFFVTSVRSRDVTVTPTAGLLQKLSFDREVRWVRCLAVAPSGNRIVGGADTNKLYIWDKGNDGKWKKPRVVAPYEDGAVIYTVNFVPGTEDKVLIAGSYKDPVALWQLPRPGKAAAELARYAKVMHRGGREIRFDDYFFSPKGTVLLGVSFQHNRWVAFDTQTGRTIPFSGTSDEFFYKPGLTVAHATANGMVYLGTKDGNVLALDLMAFEKLR